MAKYNVSNAFLGSFAIILMSAGCGDASQDDNSDGDTPVQHSNGTEGGPPTTRNEVYQAALVVNTGSGLQSAESPITFRQLSPEELQEYEAAARRNRPTIEDDGLDEISTAFILQEIAKQPPDSLMTITVSLSDPGIDTASFSRARTETEWHMAVESRKHSLKISQDTIIERLRQLDGKNFGRRWITNDVAVTIPAGRVSEILEFDGVEAIHLDNDEDEPTGFYTGLETRIGMRTQNMIANGYNGKFHSRLGASVRQRIGILETNSSASNMNYGHVAFKDSATGYLRVGPPVDCRSGTCSVQFHPLTNDHATIVAAIAAGSLEDGQDPAVTNPNERIKRSGHSPKAEIFPYIFKGGSALVAAINHAVSVHGVDVINMSFGWENKGCDRSYNVSNLNTTMHIATRDLGVLFVKSAGNDGENTGCTLSYPAQRPETLVAGALETNTALGGGVPYINLPRATWSSKGPLVIKLRDGSSDFANGVDLMAPGVLTHVPTIGGSSVYWWEDQSQAVFGTSYAAPAVAGAAANLRHALNYLFGIGVYSFHNGNNARNLLVNMLLLGSPWIKPTPSNGFGPVQMHWPHSPWDMPAPFGWGLHSGTLLQGWSAEWDVGTPGPEPAFTIWKAAMSTFETNLNSLSEVSLHVIDTCPPNGYPNPFTLDSHWDGDIRKGLKIWNTPYWQPYPVTGRCLKVRLVATQAPPSGVQFYAADYFVGGSHLIH